MTVGLLARLWLALTVVVLGSVLDTGAIMAQTTSTSSGPYVVQVDASSPGTDLARNTVFSGLAVDCGMRRGATRVAVYDGEPVPSKHLGDATLDILRELDAACPAQAGATSIGWTFVLDTRRLSAGSHTLHFVAEFANRVERTATLAIVVDNGDAPTAQMGGPVVYVRECAFYAANGSCSSYHTVATTLANVHRDQRQGQRGYTTCTTDGPTTRCNYTLNNGGATIHR